MIDSQGLFVHDRSINGFLKKAKRKGRYLGAGVWSKDKPHLLNALNEAPQVSGIISLYLSVT